MSNKTSKISRFTTALASGRTVTTQQAITRFGYASVNSVTRAVATLRQRGMRIDTVVTRAGLTGYQAA